MGRKFIQVRQLHIVTKDMSQVCICIGRYRQLQTLKRVCRQREYLIEEPWIVEGYSHATGNDGRTERHV